MKSISVLTTLMSVLSIAAVANAAEPSYPECGDKEVDAVTDAIAGLAAPCSAKTKYNFLEYPTPTDAQKTAFCTDCADLVAKIKTLRPAACTVRVFDGQQYSLKTAFTTLFGQCGVTNVQEAGADAAGTGTETAPKSDKKETAKHAHGSGSHDSDDSHAPVVGGSNGTSTTKTPSSKNKTTSNSTTTAPAAATNGAATIVVAAVTTTLTVAVASLLM